MRKLEGKVAIVTGSARGIGAAIAERLATDGAAVAINYVKAAKDAEAVAARIRKVDGKAIVVRADVSDAAQARTLVESTMNELGRLDILINNAGVTIPEPIEAIDPAHMRQQFAVNVEGPVFMMQAAASRLAKDGGRVINISALTQDHPFPGMSIYAATKGALNSMTRVWAQELGPRGITVNAVALGPTDTEALKPVLPDALRQLFISRTPLGRIAAPADIADVVAFVASNDSRWMTGHVLFATGGFIP